MLAPLAPSPSNLSSATDSSLWLAQVERLMVDLRSVYEQRNRALREITRAHHDALMRLALAAEYRDGDTGVHIMRIGVLAERVALLHGAEPEWAAMLRKAAPMHDVGKIGIPDRVLKKPGPLTPEERTVMVGHPDIGARILGRSQVPLFQLAAEVSQTHHERWDGGGYPRGLAGGQIPLSGRIVAVVDCFDALTMDRCYRPAFDDATALSMVERESGRAFDPALVALFLREADAICALRDRVNQLQPSIEDMVSIEDVGSCLLFDGAEAMEETA